MRRSPARTEVLDGVALVLASGLPLIAFLAGASPYGYWLDGNEFVAASIALGISHPPGHPLAALVGKTVSLLPLGPLPLRVAVAQALAAGLAGGFLYRAVERTLRIQGGTSDGARPLLALAAVWLAVGSYAWSFQAVRPEVYALQALLVCIAIERMTAIQAQWHRAAAVRDARPAYAAALAFGLGLANHHLVALVAAPALAVGVWPMRRPNASRRIAYTALATVAGLCTYAYLPVRASADPLVNFGDPRTVERLWWMVSGQLYLSKTGFASSQPLIERFMDTVVLLVEQLRAPAVLLAIAGLYALLRVRATRMLGIAWGSLLILHPGVRAWIGPVRNNPDVLGYLLPAFAAAAALAVCLVGAVGTMLSSGLRRRVLPFVAIAAAVLALGHGLDGTMRASLASFDATDAFAGLRYRELPPRAVVIAHLPQTVFAHWGTRATERTRPDVSLIAVPLLRHPGSAGVPDRELGGLPRTYLETGTLRHEVLQHLARRRPVRIELDVRVPPKLYPYLEPDALLYRIRESRVGPARAGHASRRQRDVYRTLERRLGEMRRETREQLLWRHYTDALYYAGVGALDAARWATERARRIAPHAPELQRLEASLQRRRADEPMDIRRFLVR